MTTEAIRPPAVYRVINMNPGDRKVERDSKVIDVANAVLASIAIAVAAWTGYSNFSSNLVVGSLLAGAYLGLSIGHSLERVHSAREVVAFSAKDIAKTTVLMGLQACCAETVPLNLFVWAFNGYRATRLFSLL